VGGDGFGVWVDVGDKEWEGFSGLGSECGKSVWQVGGDALTRGFLILDSLFLIEEGARGVGVARCPLQT
jgi:hypothetical protein